MRAARGTALAAALAAGAAWGDVLLDGHQHIGNSQDAASDFLPFDPVTSAQIIQRPANFHLTTTTTIREVRLNRAIGLDGQVELYVNGSRVGLNFCADCGGCSGRFVCGDRTLVLTIPLRLDSGFHTLAISDPSEPGNDFGFSSITLVSDETSVSRMHNQRRHIGNDNDSDDDYNVISDPNDRYPDATEGAALDIPFTLDANRRLRELRFYRLREVNTNPRYNRARVYVDGFLVGSLSASGNPFIVTTNLLLASGTHTLRIEAGEDTQSSDLDDINWDDIILLFTDTLGAGTVGYFNAVDVGDNEITGQLRTKVAGGGFSVTVAAINPPGTGVLTSYQGTVDLYLLNARDNTGLPNIYGCRATWGGAVALGSVTIGPGDQGRRTFTGTMPVAGWKEARLLMRDAALSADGCSTDNLAVRPETFADLSVSHDSETAAGTLEALNNPGSGGTPRHRAGQPFTIRARARAVGGATATGYAQSPDLPAAQALPPATVNGGVSVESWSVAAGELRTDTARYLDVGPVRFSLEDTTFAAVDSDDTPLADRRIGPVTVDAGRFIPDHFKWTLGNTPAFAAGCVDFTYLGQPVRYLTTPVGALAAVTAVAAGETTTANYAGALFKLTDPLPGASTYTAAGHAVDASRLPAVDHTLTANGDGTATLAFTAGTLANEGIALTRDDSTPEAPLDAELQLTRVVTDADGVTGTVQIGVAAPGTGIAFSGGRKQMRYGRLRVLNAYGSERAPLPVPLRAEYFVDVGGSTGFAPNPQDGCTQVPAANVAITDAESPPAAVTGSVPLSGGSGRLELTATTARADVRVTADLDGAQVPWLKADMDNDGEYDDNPWGLARFGVFAGQERRIHTRETFR